MGLDMSYQAIPAACNLIERARREPVVGELLGFVPSWLRSGQGPPRGSWPEAEALWDDLRGLSERYPGIETWNYSLDRAWDELHYLLSATRREEGRDEEETILDKAVRGGGLIADHVRATQGSHIRYSTPEEVRLIVSELRPMTVDSLRVHYDPVKMEQRSVYKFWADRAVAFELSAARCFEGFRAFYLDAAERGDGVIVCLD